MTVVPVFLGEPPRPMTLIAAGSAADLTFDRSRYCEKCHHVGFVFIEDLSEFPEGGWFRKRPCECNVSSPDVLGALRAAGIPELYLGSTLDNWTNTGRTASEKAQNAATLVRLRGIASRLDEASRDCVNVWLWGPGGTGKTWLACALLREAIIRWRYDGFFVSAPDLVRLSIDERDEYSHLREVRWLILDSIDGIPSTRSGYDLTLVADLIRTRHQAQRPTIFTAAKSLVRATDELIVSVRPLVSNYTVEASLTGDDFSTRKGVREKWS